MLCAVLPPLLGRNESFSGEQLQLPSLGASKSYQQFFFTKFSVIGLDLIQLLNTSLLSGFFLEPKTLQLSSH